MSKVLVFVESDSNGPKKASLAGISFAKDYAEKASGSYDFAVIGAGAAQAAEQLKGYGAQTIHVFGDASFNNYLAESYTTALQAAVDASAATVVASVSSSTTKDLLPRLTARLDDAAMASDVLQTLDAKTYKRPMWYGSVIATIELEAAVQVMTVRGTEFALPTQDGDSGEIHNHDTSVDLDALKTKFVALKEIKSERPDVTTADVVVAGGRGVKSEEGFKVIEDLADKLNAGIGASRAVCDAGWVPNDLQIGQTGKVVAPNLYFAIGISGAIQHLAGMKGSKTIVAINKDPEAPIFQVADYGLVEDLFKAVPQIIEQLD